MNKIIDENHVCVFCESTDRPINKDETLYCPYCNMPQFEGVTFEPDPAVASDKECFFCDKTVVPVFPLRVSAEDSPDGEAFILWDCPNCKKPNVTPDDLEILDAETLENVRL